MSQRITLHFSPVSSLDVYHFAGTVLACSRRSDSAARAKKKASERAGKKRGETREEDVFFPLFRLALFFAPAPLSVRLEQASTVYIYETIIPRYRVDFPNMVLTLKR